MWKWRVVWGTLILALCLVTGIFPGSSTQVTIDRCSVILGDWMPDETTCVGHWSTAGFTVTGQVHGVDAGSEGWRPTGNRTADGLEETPPDSARHWPAVAVPGATATYPAVVWLVRIVLLLVAAISATVLTIGTRNRRILRAYERDLARRQA